MIRPLPVLVAALVVCTSPWLSARTWTSLHGDFKIKGAEIAYNESTVLIKRDGSERIVAVDVAELSSVDREYIKAKLAESEPADGRPAMQTWTSKNGLKIRGRVLAFGQRTITIARQRGVVTIDGKAFSAIDPLHQRLLLRVISELENETLESQTDLNRWVHSLGGQPKSYTLDGVLMELESGDEIPVPFFLFSEPDLKVLQPGWETWLKSEEDTQARARENLLVQREAENYQNQQYREAEQQRIEVLKLNLLATATGLTTIWEVGLVPAQGVYGRPTTVMVSSQDSARAAAMALQQHPGYTVVAVRRASR